MKYDIDYRLINDSENPLGPFDLHEIFGFNDADDQQPVIAGSAEIQFLAVHDDVTNVEDRLRTRLRVLGSKLGAGGLVLDHRVMIVTAPKKDPQPPTTEPTEPPDEAD